MSGRPTLYSEAIVKKIERHVRQGCSKERAARAVGIGESTLHAWQAEYPEFRERLNAAREALIPELVALVHRGAKKDPRVALAFLERIAHEEYGRKTTTTVQGNPDQPIGVTISLAQAEAEIAQKLAAMSIDELRAQRAKKVASA